MTPQEFGARLHHHVHDFFAGHESRARSFDRGPIQQILPGFHVIEVDPGPLNGNWTYASVGAGFPDGSSESHLEFLMTAPSPSERHVELLAMTAHYHRTGERLALGHTFPIGEPWLPGSTLDHILVSRPYPYGPNLEMFALDGQHVHFLWLLPITKAERDYKAQNGLEALETLFDEASLTYWDPTRRSVV